MMCVDWPGAKFLFMAGGRRFAGPLPGPPSSSPALWSRRLAFGRRSASSIQRGPRRPPPPSGAPPPFRGAAPRYSRQKPTNAPYGCASLCPLTSLRRRLAGASLAAELRPPCRRSASPSIIHHRVPFATIITLTPLTPLYYPTYPLPQVYIRCILSHSYLTGHLLDYPAKKSSDHRSISMLKLLIFINAIARAIDLIVEYMHRFDRNGGGLKKGK